MDLIRLISVGVDLVPREIGWRGRDEIGIEMRRVR